VREFEKEFQVSIFISFSVLSSVRIVAISGIWFGSSVCLMLNLETVSSRVSLLFREMIAVLFELVVHFQAYG
jgi:hypothetical protein